jgi:hypothetical protein
MKNIHLKLICFNKYSIRQHIDDVCYKEIFFNGFIFLSITSILCNFIFIQLVYLSQRVAFIFLIIEAKLKLSQKRFNFIHINQLKKDSLFLLHNNNN